MSEKDILGQAVDEIARIFHESRTALREFVPLGPRQIRMTPRELRRQVENNPGLMEQMANGTPGAQQALEFLFASSNLGPRNPEEFEE